MPEAYVVRPDSGFLGRILDSGGEDAKKCYQCATCSVVCELSNGHGRIGIGRTVDRGDIVKVQAEQLPLWRGAVEVPGLPVVAPDGAESGVGLAVLRSSAPVTSPTFSSSCRSR